MAEDRLLECYYDLEMMDLISYSASWPVFNALEHIQSDQLRYGHETQEYKALLGAERKWRDRCDPFDGMTALEVKQNFCFFPHHIDELCQLLKDQLEHKSKRGNPFTVKQQVCIALYFFGKGKCCVFV